MILHKKKKLAGPNFMQTEPCGPVPQRRHSKRLLVFENAI